MRQALIGALAALVAAAAVGAVVALSGVVNVAADEPPGTLEAWFLGTVADRSVAAHSSDVEVPDLDDPAMLREGAEHYDAMCKGCHGAPGKELSKFAKSLNPMPPNLTKTENDEPKELFWVTKHGIRMTGMPAWGKTHDDAHLWDIVALMTKLPGMSPEEYARLLPPPSEREHHDHEEHDADDR